MDLKQLASSLDFKDNIIGFSSYYMAEYLKCTTPDFHKDIYNLLQSNTIRLAIASPRSFAKSTICSVTYPLWVALYGIKKDILICSASESLAVEWLRKIKAELEGNKRIKADFGDVVSDKWSETHIILKNGVNIRAKGAGAQIRGFRPDCIILDDIETDEGVLSEDQRKKLKTWLNKACINTLETTGQLIFIGTIISPLSLLNETLESDLGWTTRLFKAYKDGIEEPGYELWVEKWDHLALQKRKKEIGSFAFSSEFMNSPISDETAPIKQHQVRFWDELPHQYSVVIAVDPAYSEDDKADWKVASVVAIDQNMNRYLIEYVRTHAPTGEFINSILNLYNKYKHCLTTIGIPNSGIEKNFFSSVQTQADLKKIYPPFTELKNSFTASGTNVSIRNKKRRIIASLQPLFESGKYYIGRNHEEAKDELLGIGYSRWDDIVDTLAYAEQLIQPVFFDIEEEKVDRYGYTIQESVINDYGY